MQNTRHKQPWLKLKHIIAQGHGSALDEYLHKMSPAETARAISRLEESERAQLFTLLDHEKAAELLLDLPNAQAADLIEEITPKTAAAIVDQMPRDEQADLLSDVGSHDAEAILDAMSQDDAEKTRSLLQYPEHTAGGLMTLKYLAYPEHLSTQDVLDDFHKNREAYSDFPIQYIYIISTKGALLGTLNIRNLLLAKPHQQLKDLVSHNLVTLNDRTSLDELIQIFDRYPYIGFPVVNNRKQLIGVVHRSTIMAASSDRNRDSFLKMSGIIGGEELRSMPLLRRSLKRLSWLSINIVLNMIAACIIVRYEDTLVAAIALAAFLPIISDMSGCSGNQAVAVSIRELTMGLIQPVEIPRVFLKEIGIGILNGLTLGAVLGGVAYMWKRNIYLSIVVGGALAVNTTVSVCIGGMIPLVLKRLKWDPALASSPILTTITDMCGFFFALSFASYFIARL